MHKSRLILPLLLVICSVVARAQFVDSFDDGDFLRDPEWTGDTRSFVVNSWRQLQLHVEAAAESHLSTASEAAIDASWSFDCFISCGTSAYNLMRVYLLSDNEDPALGSGWYVQIGGANKNITLCRKTGDKTEYAIVNDDRKKILDGRSESRVHVRVTRDTEGYFTLASLVETVDKDYTTEGSVYEEYVSGKWFSVYVKNSAKNGTAFVIDNIEVMGTPQATPPDEPDPEQLHADDVAQLRHRTFTPDGDGYRDLCEVLYKMPSPAYHASLTVFTPSGVRVNEVYKDELLEEEGILTWDGTAQGGSLLDSGPYVLLFEAWNSDKGTKIRRKLTVALLR